MDERLKVAVDSAREGGEIALRYFRKKVVVKEKAVTSDVVTEADEEVGKAIISSISSRFPADNILTEEEGYIDNGGEFTWVIDDIDGTNPFRFGLPNFGVSIGGLYKGEPIIGAIYLPGLKYLFWAGKNKGAFLNRERIKVNGVDKLKKARICVDYGHFGFREEDLKSTGLPLIEKALYIDSYGCAVEALSFVACGWLSAYLHHRAFPWDFCAGTVIIQESGGMVTDRKGKSLDWRQRREMFIVASNGLVHKEILSLIK